MYTRACPALQALESCLPTPKIKALQLELPLVETACDLECARFAPSMLRAFTRGVSRC